MNSLKEEKVEEKKIPEEIARKNREYDAKITQEQKRIDDL